MPAAMQEPIELHAAGVASSSFNSTAYTGMVFDHLILFLDFTLGSLSSLDIDLEFSLDGATWWKVYDGSQGQVRLSFTASFTGAIYLTSAQNTTRMSPAVLAAPLWRVSYATTGTVTGSSVELHAVPFSIGSVKE